MAVEAGCLNPINLNGRGKGSPLPRPALMRISSQLSRAKMPQMITTLRSSLLNLSFRWCPSPKPKLRDMNNENSNTEIVPRADVLPPQVSGEVVQKRRADYNRLVRQARLA